MNLALSPEHKAFADEARDFARRNLSPATRAKTFSGKHYDRDDHMVWQQPLAARAGRLHLAEEIRRPGLGRDAALPVRETCWPRKGRRASSRSASRWSGR